MIRFQRSSLIFPTRKVTPCPYPIKSLHTTIT